MSINFALHAEGLQNPFHVKWMHINIYLYIAITSIHKAWYLYMWKNRIKNKTIQNLSNFTVYLTISKHHVGKYIFCKSEDIKMFNPLIKKILCAPILKPKTVGYAK